MEVSREFPNLHKIFTRCLVRHWVHRVQKGASSTSLTLTLSEEFTRNMLGIWRKSASGCGQTVFRSYSCLADWVGSFPNRIPAGLSIHFYPLNQFYCLGSLEWGAHCSFQKTAVIDAAVGEGGCLSEQAGLSLPRVCYCSYLRKTFTVGRTRVCTVQRKISALRMHER